MQDKLLFPNEGAVPGVYIADRTDILSGYHTDGNRFSSLLGNEFPRPELFNPTPEREEKGLQGNGAVGCPFPTTFICTAVNKGSPTNHDQAAAIQSITDDLFGTSSKPARVTPDPSAQDSFVFTTPIHETSVGLGRWDKDNARSIRLDPFSYAVFKPRPQA